MAVAVASVLVGKLTESYLQVCWCTAAMTRVLFGIVTVRQWQVCLWK